ncbi:hypothetical protein TNCT_105101 [Trichonephila clavata]|uniref:C2H2-type domain-containing protein n=1 Tax=Trichonephila clavata TaxID=2740835 RepID=A0A8X6F979_TRICU|nr:hypothetical protein TNCT_105101 [Trichonephila clavata]
MALNDGKRVCALCDEKFKTMKELKKHYEESHDDLELKYEEHVFNTDKGFEKWKKSGIVKLKSERKRHEKIGGSVKCGKTCPAFMNAIREQKEEAIKITVEYQSMHAGHEM